MRLIIFDCDGTLVDSQSNIVTKMTAVFNGLGLPQPGPRAIRELIGLSLEETIQRLRPETDQAGVDRFVDEYRRAFFSDDDAKAAPEPLFDHAEAVLQELQGQGYLLGVATGKSRRGLEAVLAGHNLLDIFVTRQTADGHPGKPNPSMLCQAMAETGVEAYDTLMLGDTSFDMAMAVNAGAHPVGAGWGYHSADDLHAAGAHVVLQNFCQLLAYVSETWPAV